MKWGETGDAKQCHFFFGDVKADRFHSRRLHMLRKSSGGRDIRQVWLLLNGGREMAVMN